MKHYLNHQPDFFDKALEKQLYDGALAQEIKRQPPK